MDPFSHFTLLILLRVKNYAAWLSKIKYAITNLDVDYFIIAITISLEDKKLLKKAIDLLISKIRNDPLMVINNIDILKNIFDKFKKQHIRK